MSKPATAKASKKYTCSCGCGEKILIGQKVIVHMGDFYSPGHYIPIEEQHPEPVPKFPVYTQTDMEPEQLELQLF